MFDPDKEPKEHKIPLLLGITEKEIEARDPNDNAYDCMLDLSGDGTITLYAGGVALLSLTPGGTLYRHSIGRYVKCFETNQKGQIKLDE